MSEQSTVRNFRILVLIVLVVGAIGASGLADRVLTHAVLRAQAANPSAAPADFTAFLAKLDAAQLELQNGQPAAFKALWSHADDVTLSGGFGGPIEQGWKAVGNRLDWVGTRFSNGTNRVERLVSNAIGDLGYVVQAEHLRFRVPGQTIESTRDYRVTMIFRREAGLWRLAHRQADSQLLKQ